MDRVPLIGHGEKHDRHENPVQRITDTALWAFLFCRGTMWFLKNKIQRKRVVQQLLLSNFKITRLPNVQNVVLEKQNFKEIASHKGVCFAYSTVIKTQR